MNWSGRQRTRRDVWCPVRPVSFLNTLVGLRGVFFRLCRLLLFDVTIEFVYIAVYLLEPDM